MNFDIIVKKDTVIANLTAARLRHRHRLEEASKLWREKLKLELDNVRELYVSGADVKELCASLEKLHTLHYNAPKDLTKNYDEALEMIKEHSVDSIPLGQEDFRNLMKDEWGWKKQWELATSAYMPT